MTRLSIRWRLTCWYAASLVLMLTVFGGLIDTLMRERLLSRTDFELDEELHELALEVELAESRAQMLEQLQLRFNDHQTFEFQVAGMTGDRWFGSRRVADVPVPIPENLADTQRRFTSLSLPAVGDSRVASQQVLTPHAACIIQVVFPLQRNLAELRDLRQLMLSVGPLMLAVAVAGGAWLARRVLTPVDRMATAAAHITAAHLDERLVVDNPHDELGHLATTFNQLLNRLQQAFSELRQFTADAAHEFRTPLAVIRSTAEVALHAPRTVEHYRDSLGAIVEEATRLTSLSNQLLTLAREDAGLAEATLTEVDLGPLVEQVVTDLEPLADDKSLEFQCDLPPGRLVLADASRLRRVFLNVLDNAIKFTPASGTVAVRLTCGPDAAVVTMVDTGPGIPAEHLARVCERFYRVDGSRNRETGGAGLGLAISRAIVERHGGRIVIRSERGRGTEVAVSLPLVRAPLSTYREPISVSI